MIFTKRKLVESVLKEIYVDDVLSGKHHSDTSGEVDAMFYKDKAVPFWNAMKQLVSRLKDDQHYTEEWAYNVGGEKGGVGRLFRIFQSNDVMDMMHQYLTDKNVYETLLEFPILGNDYDDWASLELGAYLKQSGLLDN
jgi:hypothetical protein